MRYIILMLIAVAVLTLPGTVLAQETTYIPRDDCADSDREIEGNRSTPCRFAMPEITKAEYKIYRSGSTCVEIVLLTVPDLKKNELPLHFQHFAVEWGTQGVNSYEQSLPSWPTGWALSAVTHTDGYIGLHLRSWETSSIIRDNNLVGRQIEQYPDMLIRYQVKALDSSAYAYSGRSNWVARPQPGNLVDLVNVCLALIKQEAEDAAHAAEQAAQEAAATARLQAEKDAREREEAQARREAATQATIAAQQIAAAEESKRQVAQIELVKTQTLADQIAHEEALAQLLQEIVRIRLAGQEDRARITNEYLIRSEQASADFDAETADVETNIQVYLDFNAQLLTALAEYEATLAARLADLQASLEEQQAALDALEEQARQTLEPDQTTPEP